MIKRIEDYDIRFFATLLVVLGVVVGSIVGVPDVRTRCQFDDIRVRKNG